MASLNAAVVTPPKGDATTRSRVFGLSRASFSLNSQNRGSAAVLCIPASKRAVRRIFPCETWFALDPARADRSASTLRCGLEAAIASSPSSNTGTTKLIEMESTKRARDHQREISDPLRAHAQIFPIRSDTRSNFRDNFSAKPGAPKL